MGKPTAVMDESKTEDLWEEIKGQFRIACILRKEGKLDEAVEVINSVLPPLLSQWTQANPKSSAQKRKLVEQMFHREMERVEDAWITYELVAKRLESQLTKALSAEIKEVKKHIFKILSEIDLVRNQAPVSGKPRYLKAFSRGASFFKGRRSKRRDARVSFDDIPGIIDALLEEDKK